MSRLRYICGICGIEKIDSQSPFCFYWDKDKHSVLKMCNSCHEEKKIDESRRIKDDR